MNLSTFFGDKFRLCFVAIFTITFAACNDSQRSSDPITPATGEAKSADSSGTCENKIRMQMESKSLEFSDVPEFQADVEEANHFRSQSSETEYGVHLSKDQVDGIRISHQIKSDTKSNKLEYDLSLNDAESAKPMNLSLSFAKVEPQYSSVVTEYFSVDESCTLEMTSAEMETYTRPGEEYNYQMVKHFGDGTSDVDSRHFTLPPNGILSNFLLDSDDIESFPSNAWSYSKNTGLMTLKIGSRRTQTYEAFNQKVTFSGKDAQVIAQDKVLLTGFIGEQKEQGFKISDFGKQQTWQVPKAVWITQSLGNNRADLSKIASRLPEGYLQTHNSLKIQSPEPLAYDRLSAYWTVTDVVTDPQTKMVTTALTESPSATFAAAATADELSSNKTIQADLPQIQAIAQDILKKQPSDRRAQIQLILDYLAENYEYDYEMVKKSWMRMLTTEEALSRKKGVCQHYAVIFTAVARALKIPTRIMSGFFISDGPPGFHAWNEVEVSPGLWQVIEPQDKTSLKAIHTRFYLPLFRAIFLEDNDATDIDTLNTIMNLSITVLPQSP